MDEAKSAEHETMKSLTFLDVSCMVIGYYNLFVYIRCDNIDQSTEHSNEFVRLVKVIVLLTYFQVKASRLNIVNIFERA